MQEKANAYGEAALPTDNEEKGKYISDIKSFFIRIVVFALFIFIIFGLVFGITVVTDNSMKPVLSAGDIVMFYRLDKDIRAGDVVVYETDGSDHVGRVAAIEGDIIEITDDNELYINGNKVIESEIYYETEKMDSNVSYPVKLQENEYFILCDHRTDGNDSRYFGAVKSSEIKGSLFAAVRKEGL